MVLGLLLLVKLLHGDERVVQAKVTLVLAKVTLVLTKVTLVFIIIDPKN